MSAVLARDITAWKQRHDGMLLERSHELARIESALLEARLGTGTFLVVEGPAGIGKTAVLAAAEAAAGDEGMHVLRARAAELERDFAFGVVRQLFEPLLAESSERQRAELLQGGAGQAASLLGLPGAPAEEARHATADGSSFAILHGLYWLCAHLANDAPLCVVVDDAHWADASSLRFLAFLLTRVRELDIALVLAARSEEPGTDRELLVRLKADPSAEVIRLPPLTRHAIACIVAVKLGEPEPEFVDACVRATRGSPFLVQALVDALAEEEIPPSAGFARRVERIGARTVGRSVELRLRRLCPEAGELARALAVLEEADLFTAARLAGLDESEASRASEELVAAGLFEPRRPLRFVHPIVRSGVYAQLTIAERTERHRRAADLLDELAQPSERVAEHLLESEPRGDPWVAERLVDAARRVARNGAPESAAVFLRRAIREPAPAVEQWEILLELGAAEASAGLDGWDEHLAEAVDAAPDAISGANAARIYARALNRDQCFTRAAGVLERAAAALGPADGELAAKLESAAVVVAINHPATPESLRRRRALLERAAAEPSAPPELLAVASFISVLENEPAERAVALATRALLDPAGDAPGPADQPWFSSALLSRSALALLWSERYAEVRHVIDGLVAQARSAGDGGRLAAGLATRAWLALRRGDLNGAESDARTALQTAELPAPAMYRLLNTAVLVDALVAQGELEAAESALAPLAAEVEDGSLYAGVLRLARGRLRVEQGAVAAGLEDLLAVGAVLARAGVRSPAFLPWRSDAALAYLALGDRDAAHRLAGEELALAQAFGGPRAIGLSRRVAALVEGDTRGEALLREAVEELRRGDARIELARALTDLGASLRRRNQRKEARSFLREALDLAHRAGAKCLAEQADTELRATGARPRRVVLTGLDALTASERRVAELASEGNTNREIAQMLFITARTVEGHLTSVFRKLQLDSRTDLPGVLAAR